jgi:hypothetical protein
MIRSIQGLLPESETVEEAVLLQERPRWVFPVSAIVFVIIAVSLPAAGVHPILAYALGGGVLGGIVGFGSTPWLLAKTSTTRTLLFRSSRWRASAVSLEAEIPEGTPLRRTRNLFFVDFYQLAGKKLVTSQAFRNRLDSMMAIETT